LRNEGYGGEDLGDGGRIEKEIGRIFDIIVKEGDKTRKRVKIL